MNDIIWGFALVWIVAVGFVVGNFILAQVLKALNRRKRKAALVKLEEFKALIEKRERDEGTEVKDHAGYYDPRDDVGKAY